MRQCRNPWCGQYFEPLKDFYVYCSWQCRVAHVGEAYEDPRGWQRERNAHYDRGFADGLRARPATIEIPPTIWKHLLQLSHPDRWQNAPELVERATEVTKWLLAHRPTPERRTSR